MARDKKKERMFWIETVKSIKKHLDKPIKGSGYYIPYKEKAFILVAVKLLNEKFFDGSELDEVLDKLQMKISQERKIYNKLKKEKENAIEQEV